MSAAGAARERAATPIDVVRRGRPRDAGADEAILSAAVDALGEGGISGLSMDEIARRAGVGKATIYRRWASKEALVLDALGTKPLLPTPDTGSLRGDLLAYATAVVELLQRSSPLGRAPAPDRGRVLRRAPRRVAPTTTTGSASARCARSCARARDRGEIDPDVDSDLVVDVVLGAFYFRRLVHGERFTSGYAAKVVDHVMRGRHSLSTHRASPTGPPCATARS